MPSENLSPDEKAGSAPNPNANLGPIASDPGALSRQGGEQSYEIVKTRGINVAVGSDGSTSALDAYGGYPYSLNYSINFTSPSRMTVSFVSEDGKYNTEGLAERIFPSQLDVDTSAMGMLNPNSPPTSDPTMSRGGAIDYDIITFGDEEFHMHPLKYSITDGPNGKFLQIEYFDRSIFFLDKMVVYLKGKNFPPTYEPSYLMNFGATTSDVWTDLSAWDGSPLSPFVLAVGSPYIKRGYSRGGVLLTDAKDEVDPTALPEYLYTPYELYLEIMEKLGPGAGGIFKDRVDEESLRLLWWYGRRDMAGNSFNWEPLGKSSSNENPDNMYLRNHVGTLRKVLNDWAQEFGFMFYWESKNAVDQLKLMDLSSGLSFSRISDKVREIIDDDGIKNVINKNYSYSIEDTFSKGATSYIGLEGQKNQIPFSTPFRVFDLVGLGGPSAVTTDAVTLPTTASKKDCVNFNRQDGTLPGSIYSSSAESWNKPNTCADGTDFVRPWSWVDTKKIRSDDYSIKYNGTDYSSKGSLLATYTRLIKAAMLGPKFYRNYVLLKKSVMTADAPQGFPTATSWDVKWTTTDPDTGKDIEHNAGANLALVQDESTQAGKFGYPAPWNGLDRFSNIPANVDYDTANAAYRPWKKQIVNFFYPSNSNDPDSDYGKWNNLCYPDSRGKTRGQGDQKDNLDKNSDVQSSSFVIGKDGLSVELAYSRSFESKLFRDDRIRTQLSLGSEPFEENLGEPSMSFASTKIHVLRVKKYGTSFGLLSNPEDDHIYQYLRAIGQNQGRFFYSTELLTEKTFAKRNYSAAGLSWHNRFLDVGDSPMGELAASLDFNNWSKIKPMPSPCTDGKDRESRQMDAFGRKFENKDGLGNKNNGGELNTANFTVEQFVQFVYSEDISMPTPSANAALVVSNISKTSGAILRVDIQDGGAGYPTDASFNVIFTGSGDGAAATAQSDGEGVITRITLSSSGSGYGDGTFAMIASAGANAGGINVFGGSLEGTCIDPNIGEPVGETAVGADCQDSIRAHNLSIRKRQWEEAVDCEELPPEQKGIMVLDRGPGQLSIPAALNERIQRIAESFYFVPANFNDPFVRLHDENDFQLVVVPSVSNAKELKGRPGEFKPYDELDWLLDQCELVNIDKYSIQVPDPQGKPGDWVGKWMNAKVKDLVIFDLAYAGDGPKFEASCFIKPMFSSNVASVQVQELTPSPSDVGIKSEFDDDCEQTDKLKSKRGRKKVKENLRYFTDNYASHQGDVDFNAKITVMNDGLRDKEDKKYEIFVEDGLEAISAKLDGQGVILEYTIGTRRKRRIMSAPNADLWIKAKPSMFNSTFDI